MKENGTIERAFVVNANPALTQRLDAFELHPFTRGERTLRTLSARAIKLTHDIDRGDYGTGLGLQLKKYEFSLKDVAPPRQIGLQTPVSVDAYEEGVMLRLDLKPTGIQESILNRGPLFGDVDKIEMGYFIPRIRMIGNEAIRNFVDDTDFEAASDDLATAIDAGEAKVLRPKVIIPNVVPWPVTLTPLGQSEAAQA